MIGRELTVLLGAYALAGLPVFSVASLAGLPRAEALRWWSRMALAVVLAALCMRLAA